METKYMILLFGLIAAADSGKFDSISVDEIHHHAEAGTIRAFLTDRFGKALDLSLMDTAAWNELSETWSSTANAINHQRKFGVENKGICLLMAYTLASIQMLR